MNLSCVLTGTGTFRWARSSDTGFGDFDIIRIYTYIYICIYIYMLCFVFIIGIIVSVVLRVDVRSADFIIFEGHLQKSKIGKCEPEK